MSIPHALGWTSIHFLWQGLAIALACWAVLVLARSPRLRYAIGCAGLLLMLAAPLATFRLLSDSGAPAVSPQPSAVAVSDVAIALPDRDRVVVAHASGKRDLNVIVAGLIPWLGRVWIVGVALLVVWHGLGMLQLRLIRRQSVALADTDWSVRLRRLADRLELRRSVELLVSRAIDCPAVIGCVKPAILWPAAALSGLTPTQIDALLAHELSHIRRHDHWFNLAQVCIETLLFFHPCVWWLSRRVRQERENCCDDLAASVLGDRVEYAGALLAMEDLRQARFLSLQANGGSLMSRIQRLLNVASPGPRSFRGAQGAIAVVALCASASLLVGQAPAELETSTQPSVTIEASAGPTLSSILDEFVQAKQQGVELSKTHSSFSPELAAHAQRELEIKRQWTQRTFELAGRDDASARLDAELKPILEGKSGKHLSPLLGLATREAELQLGEDSAVARRLEEKLERIVETQVERAMSDVDSKLLKGRKPVKERRLFPEKVNTREGKIELDGEAMKDLRDQLDGVAEDLAELHTDLRPELAQLGDYLAAVTDAKVQAEVAAELAEAYRHHAGANKDFEAAHAEAAKAHEQAIKAQTRAYAERDAALARRKNADEQRIYARGLREAADVQLKLERERAAARAESPAQVVTPQTMLDSLARQRDHLTQLIAAKEADANTPKEALDELRKSLAETEARIQQLIATLRPAI